MKIGMLSICAMMFMLYGTDCFARESVKDIAANWGKNADAVDDSKKDEAFERRMREAKIRKGSVEDLRSKFDQQNNREKSDKISENFEKGKYVREVSGSEQYKETADSATPARQGPWFRDKRSFADVVKGVKKEDENVREQSAESEDQFYDAVDPEYNAWLEEKNRNEKKSAEPEEQFYTDVGNESLQVKHPKKAHHAEMTKEQRAARSKKAFEARRSREKQHKKFTDEFRKN